MVTPMNPVLDQLEERVSAVATLVMSLRAEVAELERRLAARPVAAAPSLPLPQPAAPLQPCAGEESLREEIALLRAEREVVRERIGALIREIDQVSW